MPAKLVHHAPRAHSDAIAGLQLDEHKVSRARVRGRGRGRGRGRARSRGRGRGRGRGR